MICASLITLSACGGEEPENTAGSTPSTSAAAPSASAPASSAPASAPAGAATGDKELCESVKKAGEEMMDAFVAAFTSGNEPDSAELKKVLTDLSKELETLAASGGADSKVVAALKGFGAEASKAASAADPMTAAENPAFEKAGSEITAACKTAGVTVNF
ncbi:hypothetical protein [Plantactinospora sp. B5E13]|uniref:hypothetical protein n=1 Tax=Plantactinospora sp. B5E13 TaxID=3153758 RepID=UPI00325CB0BF